MNCKLPAYPLLTKDPFFSVWSGSDILNEADTTFWNGKSMRTYGMVYANGRCYSFLGNPPGATRLLQTSLAVNLFSTDYGFTCEEFDLHVSFVSPLPLDNLELLSCPVCYISYEITAKTALKDASVAIVLDEEYLYNRQQKDVKGGVFKLGGCEAAYFGLRRQLPLSHSYDSVSAEWGYYYLTGDNCMFCSKTALDRYIFTGKAEYCLQREERKYLFASNTLNAGKKNSRGKIAVAFDDTVSIFYFGDYLKGYYFQDGKTIFTAIDESLKNYDGILKSLGDFQKRVYGDASAYGEKYRHILNASYRQSVAAHKLVQDRDGNLLFLSKECHSNGCIATVDITYLSCPLYLCYNPALAEAMLRPIFKFAKMPAWPFEYAPHDAGTYPYCLGQTYSIQENDDKYHAKSIFFVPDKNEENYPMFYQFPKGSDLYTEYYQMPVEECSNMLILTAAVTIATDRENTAKENLSLLKQWADYLLKHGYIPSNQPCTDDFADRLDQNMNLSVKAAVGLAAFSVILKRLGDPSHSKYLDAAKEFARAWQEKADKYKHSPITFDADDSTFSLKYNLAFDLLFGTKLFSKQTYEREIACYLGKMREYGIPLDSRSTITKSDWQMWVALFGDSNQRQAVIDVLYKFLTESISRVPFTDLYDAATSKQREFQNRTVQGAMFILILHDKNLLTAR